ncbi:serine hydrolase [Streptomyces roseolus]|uniref:serine hydrolase n=1 Tax=Streptomyces roseolus TaxID=67358 RepID=UPI0037A8CA44
MSGKVPGGGPERSIRSAFADAQVTGWLHAVDIDSGAEVAVEAESLVSTASVHKLCLAVTVQRLADAGRLDPTERLEIAVTGRTAGLTGLAMLRDPVAMSVRDLLALALTVSDNASADVLFERIGLPTVNTTMRQLGLHKTVAVHTTRQLIDSITEDCDGDESLLHLDPGVLTRLRVLDPLRTNRSTPREMTSLLGALWRDEACSPERAEELRRILSLQVWPHRLVSGFPFDDVRVAGKTGTLPTLRSEVGVVDYPDGGRYAVAVFTRAARTAVRQPAADAVIGTSARIAIDHLRALRPPA